MAKKGLLQGGEAVAEARYAGRAEGFREGLLMAIHVCKALSGSDQDFLAADCVLMLQPFYEEMYDEIDGPRP